MARTLLFNFMINLRILILAKQDWKITARTLLDSKTKQKKKKLKAASSNATVLLHYIHINYANRFANRLQEQEQEQFANRLQEQRKEQEQDRMVIKADFERC